MPASPSTASSHTAAEWDDPVLATVESQIRVDHVTWQNAQGKTVLEVSPRSSLHLCEQGYLARHGDIESWGSTPRLARVNLQRRMTLLMLTEVDSREGLGRAGHPRARPSEAPTVSSPSCASSPRATTRAAFSVVESAHDRTGAGDEVVWTNLASSPSSILSSPFPTSPASSEYTVFSEDAVDVVPVAATSDRSSVAARGSLVDACRRRARISTVELPGSAH